MLSLAHLISLLVPYVFGAGLIVSSVTVFIHLIWHYLHNHQLVSAPFVFNEYLYYSGLLLIALFTLNLVFFALKSRLRSIKRLVEYNRILPPSQRLQDSFKEVSKQMKVRAKLYVVEGNTLAFAHQLLFRNTVVIGKDFAMQLGESSDTLKWVIAHELAHIKHNDSLIGGLRIVIDQMFIDLLNLRVKFYNILIIIANFLKIRPWFFKLVTSPIMLAFFITKHSYFFIKRLFVFFDRHMQRKLEYRADRVATKFIGKAPGIAILSALKGHSLEPSFNIFATHPSSSNRIKAIEKLS